jgi:hypothetical protein
MRSIRIRGTERESEGGASGPMDSEYGLMFHGLDVECLLIVIIPGIPKVMAVGS